MKTGAGFLISMVLLTVSLQAQSGNPKFEKWQESSFFRGFNVLDYTGLELSDFRDLKQAGASLAYISTSGIWEVEAPYALRQENLARLDQLIAYCREIELHYAIAVREGPGRRDVYQESEAGAPPSTIWTNREEQQAYGSMVRLIAARYDADSFFVGLGLIVEPNPLFQQLHISAASLASRLEQNGIDLTGLNRLLIDSVRSVSKTLPLLVQNVAYSSPEFFSLMEAQDDPYIVYEFHNYRPREYVKADVPFTQEYPDMYFSFIEQSTVRHDKAYLSGEVLQDVREFQQTAKAPMFMGEFGLKHSQENGPQFLQDVMDIALESGWHFALWDYRSGRGNGAYDYERKGAEYWNVVQEMFVKPAPVSDKEDDPATSAGAEALSVPVLKVYPNPAVGSVNVRVNLQHIRNATLSVQDILGRELLVRALPAGMYHGGITIPLDIADLPAGVYHVVVRKSQGQSSKTRFIKK